MSSIDERVVELRFDNAQFEAGVKTSLNTLERLKHGLRLGDASRSLKEFQSTTNKFNLDQVAVSVDHVAERFTFLGNLVDTLRTRVSNSIISMATAFPKKVFNQIVQGGINRAHNIEQARFQLEGLKIAWDDVSKSIDEAVSGTAYGMDAAAMAASQLAASNVQLGDDMTQSLRAISGVAAMTNSSYEDISRIFTSVAGNGRLMGDQLLQLSGRGLNAAATLAEALQTTEAEVREMVSHGQIDFMTFARAMDEAFGEHAKDANKTFSGAMSNIKASLSRIGAQFAQPFFENIKFTLGYRLLPVMKQIEAKFKPLSAAFTVFMQDATRYADSLLEKLYRFLGGTDELNVKTIDAKGFVSSVEASAEKIVEKGKEILGIQEENTEETEKTGKVLKENKDTQEEIERLAKEVILGKYGNGEERRKKLEEEGHVYEIIQNRVNELLGCSKRYEVQQNKTAEASSEAAEASKELAETPFEKLMNVLDGIHAAISIIGNAAVAIFTNLIVPVTKWGIKAILNGILFVLNPIGKALVAINESITKNNIFDKGTKKIARGFIGLKNALSGFFGEVRKTDGVKMLANTMGRLWDAIKSLGGSVIEKVTSAISHFFDTMEKLDTSSFSPVIDGINNLTLAISNFVSNGLKRLPFFDQFFLNPFEKAEKSTKKKTKEIRENIYSMFDPIRGKASEFDNRSTFQKILDFFSALKKNVGDFYVAIKNSEGIKNLVSSLERLWKIVSDFTSSKIGQFSDFLSRTFGAGADIATGSWDKALNLINSIAQALSNLLNSLMDGTFTWESFFEPIKSFIASLGADENGEGGLVNFFAKLFGKPAEAFSSIKATIDDLITKIKEYFKNFDLKKVLGDVFDGAKIVSLILAALSLRNFSVAAKNFTSPFKSIGKYIGALAHKENSEAILNIAKAIGFLAGSLWLIAQIPDDKIESSLKVLGVIAAGVLAVYAVMGVIDKLKEMGSSGGGKDFSGLLQPISSGLNAFLKGLGQAFKGIKFAAIGVGLLLLVTSLEKIIGVLKKISGFDVSGLKQNINAYIAVFGSLFLLAIAARIAGTGAIGFGVGMILIGNAIDIMIGVLQKIIELDVPASKLDKAINTIVTGIIGMGLVLALGTRISSGGMNALLFGVGMVAVAGSLYLAALGLEKLASIPEEDLKKATPVMLEVVGAMAVLSRSAAKIQGFSAVLGLVAMIFLLMEVVHALKVLTEMDMEKLGKSVLALDSVILALSNFMKNLSKLKTGNAVAILLGLLGCAGVLGAVVFALWGIQELGISDTLIDSTWKIALLVKALGDTVSKLGGAGVDWLSGIKGAWNLISFVGVIGLAVTAFTKLYKTFTKKDFSFKDFFDDLQPTLGSLGTALGELVGNFIGTGVGEAVTGGLPTIGENLSDFSEKIKTFCTNIAEVGPEVKTGAENLAGAMLAITGANIAQDNIFTRILTLGFDKHEVDESGKGHWKSAFEQKLDDIMSMANTLTEFNKTIADLGEDDWTQIENATDAIQKVADIDVAKKGGLVGMITGTASLSDLATGLKDIAEPLKTFAGDVKGADFSGVEPAATAINQIATAASTIPNSGGKLADWIGDNGIAAWCDELSSAGEDLVTFSDSVKGSIDLVGVTLAAKAVNAMASAAKGIPNSGGVVAFWVGDNKLLKWSDELSRSAPNIAAFSRSIVANGGVDLEAVTNAAAAVTEIAKAAKEIPNEGGKLADWIGDNGIATWGAELSSLGHYLKAMSDSAAKIDEKGIKAINDTLETVGEWPTKLQELDIAVDDINLVGALADSLKTFSKSIKDIDTANINTISTSIASLVKSAKDCKDAKFNNFSFDGLTNALSMFSAQGGSNMVAEFAAGIMAATSKATGAARFVLGLTITALEKKDRFRKAGRKTGGAYASGVSSKKEDASSAGKGVAESTVSGMKNGASESRAVALGRDFGNGYIKGIKSKYKPAYDAGYGLGEQSTKGATEATKIGSPSKVMIKVGKFIGEGFVIGIDSFGKKVSAAGARLGNAAITNVASPLQKIAETINSDLDVDPTIRPVMDLSNIQNGVKSINSMMPNTRLNVGLASSGFSKTSRISNGDIVDAINMLKDREPIKNGDTYIVNGVTYDDGSNVSDAVRSLIRAARVERRA